MTESAAAPRPSLILRVDARLLRAAFGVLALNVAWSLAMAAPGPDPTEEQLVHMSLQDLTNVEVTSVSKSAEPLSRAPAAVYVITHDEIVRSGATSIAEALRLAPNLQVRRLTSTSYAISARGFGGNQGDQNFSNKLLVLIDGRSVYSPLFSGVYFDAQNVLLQDVDRIEIVSGPGATLWGANAMNGVINIITRPAYLSQGTFASSSAGNQEQNGNVRYGGKINDETAYRLYGLAFRRDALELPDGASARDAWWNGQTGFRIDSASADDSLTVQGDVYHAIEDQPGAASQLVAGANVLGRWQHHTARSDLQVQAYFDDSQRGTPNGGAGFVLHTYDIEVQQSLGVGAANRLVWGAGERLNNYELRTVPGPATSLLFDPTHRSLTLANIFAQDTWTIVPALSLTAGIKLEDDAFSGWAFQPDARLSWMVTDTHQLWAAVSRAIRSPTPFDEDVQEKVGQVVFLTGNRDFKPERVTAYEVGYRGQPLARLSLSASVFYNHYDDLRTINAGPSAGPAPFGLPLSWGNDMTGNTYGVEAWADVQITDWWRLSPGFRSLHEELRFKPGYVAVVGISQAGDDPSAQGFLKSSMDLGPHVTFDAALRYVNALPDPALPSYYEMSARLAWRVLPRLELALSGKNLLHARHLEYPSPDGEAIPRSGMLEVRWGF
ncbi:MAG TPA: TonB-dependent receptor [Steroidobacteraceae bacterium]|nr:TonB-dependent receptor [Steroidobacteraceae bacterium]